RQGEDPRCRPLTPGAARLLGAGRGRDLQDGRGAEGQFLLLRLRALFEQTEAGQRAVQEGCGTVAGCLFGNLALELRNHAEPVRGRLQEIFEAQVDMVEAVVVEARDRGAVTVSDPRQAARAVVAQLEGQVMFAKLYNSPERLSPLWDNCRALLGAAGS
ncbi:LOW QUALITY PROTEIN: TetR-family transcriptional regulator, partial [Streptomyces sviceus ATCC 29083]